MSDDFIPLNQSTPVQHKWQPGRNQNKRYQNNRKHNGNRRGRLNNVWSDSPRSSFESNSSNNSYGHDSRGGNIDAYLHPSMLQDPWQSLRKKNQLNNTS